MEYVIMQRAKLAFIASLMLSTMASAETEMQQIVAEIFKSHPSDRERLHMLQVCLANNFHTQDHNWFQQVAYMRAEDQRRVIEEYTCYLKELELRVKPLREAIRFLEDKLAFFEEAQKQETWGAGKEQQKKDVLIFAGGVLAVIGVMMAAALQVTF